MENNKPCLVIMAAGLGSRFGGMKQIASVDEDEHIIMDYSVFDARRGGFQKVICVIKEEKEAEFEEKIGKRLRNFVELKYAYQKIDDIPQGFSVPEGRQKPWGTGHAVLAAMPYIEGPFAVINADDFYGADAYKKMYEFLSTKETDKEHAMIGYHLRNTMSESGFVARGVCAVSKEGFLENIVERTKIKKAGEHGEFTEDEGETFTHLDGETIVSLNLFGFSQSFIYELKDRFKGFLEKGLAENPLKCEYFLPSVVGSIIEEKLGSIKVLTSRDNWYGITYLEDMPSLKKAIADMKKEGKYPEKLWE